ncbi:hypothetical protein [Catenulispora yoronensis]
MVEREPTGDDLPPHADDKKGGAKSDAEAFGAPEDDGLLQGRIINFAQFNSNFTAPDAMFGVGGQQTTTRRKATGWVDAAEMDSTLKCYVHPRPCFDRAAAALEDDKVVVLTAPSGSGKRAGALALIRGFIEDDRCVVLSPDSTLDELAKREFQTGLGYVLLDRRNEPLAEPDFAWRQVRDRLRADKAFLVVTTVHDLPANPETVQHIEWRTPEPKQVLEARLRGCEPTLIDEALAGLPGDCTLRDAVAVADLLISGVTPAEAWERQGGNAVQVVRKWFTEARTLSDYSAITTMAFAVGSNRRTFETLQKQLDDRLAPPEPKAAEPAELAAQEAKPKPEPAFAPVYDRRRVLKDNPLVATQELPAGTITRSVLVFADPRYRQWVLDELWETCGTPFWDAVRDWLTDVVAENTDELLELAIATGLAQLARTTFDEVMHSYLVPWASGRGRRACQTFAVQVLWCMCLDEDLAGAAVSVARDWIANGSVVQRSTAVVAFGGMLGVRFPHDAVKRLWHQVEFGGSVSAAAQEHLGYLFAALIECDEDATVVTELLRHRMRLQRRTAVTSKIKELTFQTVIGLLELLDWESEKPVCAIALAQQPAVTSELAELCARVLVFRPHRTEAKAALMKIVKALPETCSEPRLTAQRFGRALGLALPAQERQLLFDALHPRRDPRNDDLAGVFLLAVRKPEDEPNHE